MNRNHHLWLKSSVSVQSDIDLWINFCLNLFWKRN